MINASDPASTIANMVVDDLVQQGYVLPMDDCDELRHSAACVIGGALDVQAEIQTWCAWDGALQFGSLDRRFIAVKLYRTRRGPWFEITHRRQPHAQNRCYCPGTSEGGGLRFLGWQLEWWASFYGGPIPCHCDRVTAELFPGEDA